MRQQAINVQNVFSRGLITENTGLNFPEDACTETYDCKFDFKGSVSRRLGFDYETGYETDSETRDSSAMVEYVWKSVGGDGSLSFVVTQIGTKIYFYTEDIDGPLSPGRQSFSIDLTSLDTTGNPGVGAEPCQFASGKGLLFVSHPYCDPFYVTYNSSGPSISTTAITVKTRDFNGLTSTATYPDFTTRPTSTRAALDDFDEYNLLNQGWGRTIRTSGGADAVALDQWDTANTTMPALADIWYSWATTDAPPTYNYANPSSNPPSNFRAAQGYYILNEFSQERDTVSGIAGLSDDDVTSSYFRPKTIAFYAGRVFYAGTDYAGYNSKIYFSQIIEHNRQIGFCYQKNDPTSEQNADLLPDDGGVIVIPDLATVYKLFVMGPNLVVFASNGVWMISGSGTDGLGFTAEDYSVLKLSSTPAISALSFIDAEGVPFWWNFYGIWTISPDQSGRPSVISLTEQTIQEFFDEIPALMKNFVKGAYNDTAKIIQWLYRSESTSDLDEKYEYDRVLNLNLRTGAFYPWTIDTTVGVLVNGVVNIRGTAEVTEEDIVVDSGSVTVTTSSGETVIADVVTSAVFGSAFRYFVSKNTSGTTYDVTFATEADENYEDWETPGTGVSYESYLITGYSLKGETIKKWQPSYVRVFTRDEGDCSLFIQGVWDYHVSAVTNRWSDAQQCCNSRQTGRFINTRRLKIRGHGLSCQLKFYSEDNKPFELIGWSEWDSGNASP